MSKDINHNMEPAFTRALYFENTQVPDYLINNYQAIGLSDQQFIDLLRVLACQQKFSAYVEQDKLLAKWNGQQAEMSAALAALQQQGVLERLEDVPGVVFSLNFGFFSTACRLLLMRRLSRSQLRLMNGRLSGRLINFLRANLPGRFPRWSWRS